MSNPPDCSFYGEMSRLMPASQYKKPQFVEFLRSIVPAGSSILDVGCGIGIDSELLARALDCHVTGFDASIECVFEAKQRGVATVVANWGERWPFAERFDLVLAAFVVHQVSDLRSFFARSTEILKHGGRIAVLTASHDDIRRRQLTKYFPALAGMDIDRYPSVDAVRDAMTFAGLRRIDVRSLVVRTETITPEYLRIVRDRLWSSLRLIPEDEFQSGLRDFNRAVGEWERDGSFPQWENRKTLILAERD